ncbi:hypothetical protein NE237_032072 [Protea cynaroides]|uniref:Uncharacterized protein n=1 Tax=Protea cynaroides TaxID=273540 RepID=A0A9Q0R2R0_9MAGN|nr:hypothetical protein NE237_032072 [Protea cynaroides]
MYILFFCHQELGQGDMVRGRGRWNTGSRQGKGEVLGHPKALYKGCPSLALTSQEGIGMASATPSAMQSTTPSILTPTSQIDVEATVASKEVSCLAIISPPLVDRIAPPKGTRPSHSGSSTPAVATPPLLTKMLVRACWKSPVGLVRPRKAWEQREGSLYRG